MGAPAAWPAPGPEMTILHASAQHAALLQALPSLEADPRIDMSGVTEFDSAGLQLLLALRRSLAERGQTLQLVGNSAPVRDALQVFGLDALFEANENPESH